MIYNRDRKKFFSMASKTQIRHRKAVAGTIYLLHFSAPYCHAKHYLGWTEGPIEERLARHSAGQGARLLEVITAAGLTFELTRTWEGTRELERQLKNRHEAPRLCPLCQAQTLRKPVGREQATRRKQAHYA